MITESQELLLRLISDALFGFKSEIAESNKWEPIRKEAVIQTVPMLAFSVAEQYLPEKTKDIWRKSVHRTIANNMRVSYEHCEVGELMRKSRIPYVILKGKASAHYYAQPDLRSLGDVDFLVREEHMERASKVLSEAGFQREGDAAGIHIAYHRPPGSVLEMHRGVNGIPKGAAGDICRKYLSDIIETSVPLETPEGECLIPDAFHHGLVLLLHTASHLTSEGIGLRHLCDWAVFYSSLSEKEFTDLFEEKLKACGLWRFARLLTLTSIRYLHAPERPWAGEADEMLLSAIITDIMNGGNFGQKDADRYRQIKYISNRGEYTVDKKGVLRQVADTIDKKAKAEHKSKIGVLADYAGLVLRGERKPDNRSTLKEAEKRKNIYQEFHLFEPG